MNKVNPHTPGAKLDQGKNRMGLIINGFPRALEVVGKVGTFGAEKYTKDGWKHVDNGIERYTDAMLRHFLENAKGNYLDDETKLPHLAAVAWNNLALLELTLMQMDEEGSDY